MPQQILFFHYVIINIILIFKYELRKKLQILNLAKSRPKIVIDSQFRNNNNNNNNNKKKTVFLKLRCEFSWWLIDWLFNWLIDGSFDFFYEKINAGQVRSWNRYCCSSNGKLQLPPLPPPPPLVINFLFDKNFFFSGFFLSSEITGITWRRSWPSEMSNITRLSHTRTINSYYNLWLIFSIAVILAINLNSL